MKVLLIYLGNYSYFINKMEFNYGEDLTYLQVRFKHFRNETMKLKEENPDDFRNFI